MERLLEKVRSEAKRLEVKVVQLSSQLSNEKEKTRETIRLLQEENQKAVDKFEGSLSALTQGASASEDYPNNAFQ